MKSLRARLPDPAALVHVLVAALFLSLLSLSVAGVPARGDTDVHPNDASRSSIATTEWSLPAPLAQHSLLLDAVAVGSRIVAVGERGHILVSTDRGETWSQVLGPSRRMLTAITATDSQHVWAAGHDAAILHSSDGGESWSRQSWDPELNAPLFDIWLGEDEYGLAVGAYGLSLGSRDGGATWQRTTLTDGDPHLYAIAESPAGLLYVAGEFGTLLRSMDRGRSWDRLPSPYDGSFFGILAPSGASVLAFGLRGNLHRSDDGGNSWQHIAIPTGVSLLGGCQRPDGTLFLAGLGGTILVSADQGRSFTKATSSNRQSLSTVIPTAQSQLLLVGEGGARLERDGSLGLPWNVSLGDLHP